jgi:signal transduction histidine kinase
VARGLHPVLLRDLGLADSLRAFAQTLSSPRLNVEVDVADGLPTLGNDLALALYRIAQEAVLNAIRHAGSQRIRLVLRPEIGIVRLVVSDDGCGFDTRNAAGHGLGLLGMEQRALAVGGALEVDAAPERGTRVTFTCPTS